MSFTLPVNATAPPNLVCMSVLARYSTQYLVMDRCCGFVFEQFDCFEFISQLNSLTILDAFDDFEAARATFELIHEREPDLITLKRRPVPFDNVETVSVRDHCEAYHG
ncbi:MAG: hypothetical protein ABJH52_07170 [Henriciella sp.]